MPNVDFDIGALTIPVFTAIFGAGWTSCFVILVRPMRERLSSLESKLDAIEKAKDAELAALRDRLGLR